MGVFMAARYAGATIRTGDSVMRSGLFFHVLSLRLASRAAGVLLGLAAWLCPMQGWAQGVVWSLPTREGVKTSVYWEAAPKAWATVILFPGGTGGLGKMEQGRPGSRNFLVRSVQDFLDQGLNVAVFGRPNGQEIEPSDRMSEAHMQDIRQVLQAVRAQSTQPVWLVGTSRGTTSVATAASKLGDAGIAGVVMTSSIVAPSEPGALPSLDLASVRMPVLLMQHERDACKLCTPADMPAVLERFTQAPVKRLRIVDGGANPTGGVCHALHWHGFIGMEHEAVQSIAQWMRQPLP
jgi:predicted alpha/beta-hydrolase family hydrolase